jgi:hypothetical protein
VFPVVWYIAVEVLPPLVSELFCASIDGLGIVLLGIRPPMTFSPVNIHAVHRQAWPVLVRAVPAVVLADTPLRALQPVRSGIGRQRRTLGTWVESSVPCLLPFNSPLLLGFCPPDFEAFLELRPRWGRCVACSADVILPIGYYSYGEDHWGSAESKVVMP